MAQVHKKPQQANAKQIVYGTCGALLMLGFLYGWGVIDEMRTRQDQQRRQEQQEQDAERARQMEQRRQAQARTEAKRNAREVRGKEYERWRRYIQYNNFIIPEDKNEAILVARDFVKLGLKCPSTAQFPESTIEHQRTRFTLSHGQRSCVVTGIVDAQNDLGAMRRCKYYCLMRKAEQGTKWECLDMQLE